MQYYLGSHTCSTSYKWGKQSESPSLLHEWCETGSFGIYVMYTYIHVQTIYIWYIYTIVLCNIYSFNVINCALHGTYMYVQLYCAIILYYSYLVHVSLGARLNCWQLVCNAASFNSVLHTI